MLQYQLILQQELLKRKRKKSSLYVVRDWPTSLIASLFTQQKAFVLSPSKAKIAQCTRRAGKTEAASVCLLLAAAATPNSTALYLALTRKSAKNLLWPKLKKLKAQYNIPLDFNESDLTATLPNGSKIMLYGADQENVVERLRGDAYCICVIDEAASFGEHLDYVIEDVIEPALLDYNGGLIMVGSPGPTLTGPFYRACVDPGELRRFARDLTRFNGDLQALMGGLQTRLKELEKSWTDQEQKRFAQEFEQTVKALRRFLDASTQHAAFLVKKARHIDDYLQQR